MAAQATRYALAGICGICGICGTFGSRGSRGTGAALALPGGRLRRHPGLAATPMAGEAQALQALDDGTAAEHFERMVAGLGGPTAVLRDARLPVAPVQRALPAPCAGWLAAMDTRALGLAVVALGGGRQRPGDRIDARVGLADVLPPGTAVAAGERLLTVHAASDTDADAALAAISAALHIADDAPAAAPIVHARFTHDAPPQGVQSP